MKPLLLATASALAILPATANAFDPALDPADTDTLIVIGERLEDRALQSLETPSLGAAVAADQIAAVNAFNVEDSFKYAPDLIVRKRYIGDNNATLSFRGMHTQQTPRALVTVDGFLISNFLGASFGFAPKWAVVAPSDIDRVEIVYGPASARYAGNAMGGALLMKTRDVTETDARASLQYFSGGYDYYDTDLALQGWAADIAADFVLGDRGTLSVGYRHFENEGQPQQWRTVSSGSAHADQAVVDMGLGFPLRLGAEDSVVVSTEDQLRLRGTYDFGGGWEGRLLASLLKDEERTDEPHSYLQDETGAESFIGVSGTTLGLNDKTELLVGAGLSGTLAGWDLDFALSRFDMLENDTWSTTLDPVTGLFPVSGLYMDEGDDGWTAFEVLAERAFGNHAIATGLSHAAYSFDTPVYATDDWQAASNKALRNASGGETRLSGVFVEDAIRVSPKWLATLGLRAESWEASDGYLFNTGTELSYESRSETALSPKAALTFSPDRRWAFTASAAQATRFPTVQELYQAGLIQYGADVGAVDLGGFDPDLKPEEALDLQLTATASFKKAILTVSLFRQDVEDTLFTQTIAIPAPGAPGDLVQQSLVSNIGEVRTDGIDFIAALEDVLIDGLSIDANLSLLDATITENPLNPDLEGNRFPRVPDKRANLSVRYVPSADWLFAAGWRYQDTPDRNIENTSNSVCDTYYCVTGFSIVDVKATRWIGPVALSAGIDNINDERAFVFHPYPGRTAMLEIKWDGGR